MRIDVRGQNLTLSEAIGTYAERRFQVALGRLGRRLPQVTVRLSDENGPKGGVDKRCQVVVAIPPDHVMTIDEQHADLYQAIDFAADRAARAVTREIGRRRARRTQAAERRAVERTGFSRGGFTES